MSNSRKATHFLLSLITALSLAGVSAGQTQQQQQQNRSQQQSSMRDQIQQTQQQQNLKDPESFEGRISERLGRYFLTLSDRKNSYRLAEDWKAKRFVGKTVRVTGTLDENTNTMHVHTVSQIPERPR